MNALRSRPNHIVVSALLGNCAGAIACAIVVAAFLVGWGEFPTLGVLGLFESSFSFAGYAWLVGIAYLVVVLPALFTARHFLAPSAAAYVGITLAIAPGVTWLLRGNYYYGSAGFAQGLVAALVAIYLSYRFWGGASNQPLHPTPSAAEAAASAPGERRR